MTSAETTTGFDNLSLIRALDNSMDALAALPPYLRTLLAADGTVTRGLEAYFWEPIDVVQIEQAEKPCADDIPELGVTRGTTVLVRKVELRGRLSKRLFSKASSIIKIADIPVSWREELKSGRLGIGTLISDSGMESYREITHYNLTTNQSDEVSRSYRIFLHKQPSILITEYFPTAVYQHTDNTV